MRIYSIGMYENPTAERIAAMRSVIYAHFSVVGTWAYRREPCKVCGYYWQEVVPPLLVQWEPSTHVVGDFSWDGPFGDQFVVKDHVAAALNSMSFECRFLQVDFVEPKRTRNVVPFPYEGPHLFWGRCSAIVDLDMEASGVQLLSACSSCGDVRYSFRKSGVIIRHRNWNQHKMFRVTTNGPALTFVTEDGRRLIQAGGFSNIAFTEAGEIVD